MTAPTETGTGLYVDALGKLVAERDALTQQLQQAQVELEHVPRYRAAFLRLTKLLEASQAELQQAQDDRDTAQTQARAFERGFKSLQEREAQLIAELQQVKDDRDRVKGAQK